MGRLREKFTAPGAGIRRDGYGPAEMSSKAPGRGIGYSAAMHSRIAATLIVLVLALAACGAPGAVSSPTAAPAASPGASGACAAAPDPGQPQGWGRPSPAPAVLPILINPTGELTCGANRLLFSFLDSQNRPVGKPDRTASVALYNLARDASRPAVTVSGTFVWAIEGSVGIYVANVSFAEAGVWGAEFTTAAAGARTDTVRMTFSVSPSTKVVRVGQKAPASKTPTGDPATISTDTRPDPAFYATSVDAALADRKPFVLVFATPKFCASGQCGPTLERIKPFKATYPSVTFINVEPYQLKLDGGQLQPVLTQNQLTPAQSTIEWGLPAEPWVFVVDRDGIVRGSLSLIFGDAELAAAIDLVK